MVDPNNRRPSYQTEPREDLELRCVYLTRILYEAALKDTDCECEGCTFLGGILDDLQKVAVQQGLTDVKDWREVYDQ